MKVVSTTDVSLEVLSDLKAELGPEFDLDIETRVGLHSAEPPSWVSFIAESQWWVQALAAYAAVYVAEIVKEAGKDTWRNRGKGYAVLGSSTDKLKRFARAIARALSRLRPQTRAIVGLPVPDDIYTTQLYLSSADENELAVELAMFVHHLPLLIKVMENEGITAGRVSGWVGLTLLADGSLEVSWFDKKSLDQVRRVIPFQSAP